MAAIRDHKIWEVTVSFDYNETRAVNEDTWERTGRILSAKKTIWIVAPDKEMTVRAFVLDHFKYHGMDNMEITEVTKRDLTAFIQEHQW